MQRTISIDKRFGGLYIGLEMITHRSHRHDAITARTGQLTGRRARCRMVNRNPICANRPNNRVIAGDVRARRDPGW